MIDLAQLIADQGARSGTFRRRAVSTAYYALFHGLQELCADRLIGREARLTVEYATVYRSLEHGPMKDAFGKEPLRSHPAIKSIGAAIVEMQRLRHLADYAPPENLFTRKECGDKIELARKVLLELRALTPPEQRLLAVNLLFRSGKRS